MIYTSTKALQFLSVPVYTIFKNLTIIVIAYGEVLWFGGSVSPLALLSFGLMVLSSVIAAWADIQAAISGVGYSPEAAEALSTLNAGYAWMGLNVFCTASYLLTMRKHIKKMNFKDWDSKSSHNRLRYEPSANVPSQLCSTTTSSPFRSSLSARWLPRIGPPKTCSGTSPWKPASRYSSA